MAKNQVSIIIPKLHYAEPPHLFMGVLCLASALDKNGIKVKIYDEQIGEATKNLQEIISSSFLVGFTVMTNQLKSASELSKQIHKSEIPIAWGGHHPTLFPEQCLKEEYVDYVLFDEGEQTLIELASKISKNNFSPKEILGLWYKTKQQSIKNHPRPYININELSPNWKLVNLNNYKDTRQFEKIIIPVSYIHTGRGCPYECTFCINTLLNKRQWRGLTAENIIREIKNLMQYRKIEFIDFVDENFFIDKKRLEKFCDLYRQEGFTFGWYSCSRLTYLKPNHIDDALLFKLKNSGCVQIGMGIESGSQRVIDELIKKGIKTEDVIPVIKRLKKVGIQATCSFLIGIPKETEKEQIQTIDLIKKILITDPTVDISGPQLYRPYPGAEMYSMAKRMGFIEPKDIESWITFMNESGFIDVRKLPWIKNPIKLRNTYKFVAYSQIRPTGLAYIPGNFFKTLFKLRMKMNFYSLAIDLYSYEKLKDLYLQNP